MPAGNIQAQIIFAQAALQRGQPHGDNLSGIIHQVDGFEQFRCRYAGVQQLTELRRAGQPLHLQDFT